MRVYYNDNDPRIAVWLREIVAAGLISAGNVDDRSITEVQASDLEEYTRCHFFAGIGGWDYALKLAGWPADKPVWTGSCPCQPFSSAGKRRGTDDPRHLWPEWCRLIAECRPPVVFGEQVASSEVVGTQQEAAFLVAVQNGDYARANKLAKRLAQKHGFHYWARWVDGVQADLAREGYAFRFKVLGAHSVGAPHIRQRLWWVAHAQVSERRGAGGTEDGGRRAQEAGRPGAPGGLADAERAARREEPQGRHDNDRDDARRQEAPGGPATRGAGAWEQSIWVVCGDGKYRRVPGRPYQCTDGDGAATDGTEQQLIPEPALFPLAYGLPGRVGLLRGYGNAICPQVAAEFIQSWREAR